ncbi:PAS domain-containing protein [Hwanghaeella grinnelliae]|uniref:PAS domain-containing protein n=1 Tax=Hwanghaeella grinnelliae TaxID=2500179 RepID=A0A437QY65_9PROT|nr:PAS domain-containing protein [Hwanghaeella grinnelliae]RVU39474.1 PAS domain-containing protein [Hwanghaeella grinnelliae]
MNWIRQFPRSTVPIEEAPGLFATLAPRIVAKAYLELMRDAGGNVPRKTGLDISKFAAALPNVALFAVKLPDHCVYRILGEAWRQRIGRNLVGKNYIDFVAAERRESAITSLQDMITIPSAFRVIIEQTYSAGKKAQLEVLAVPLLSEEEGVDSFSLFAAQLVTPVHFGPGDDRIVLGANIIERDLIDIGYGVNDAFYDLVRPH